ncbi:MAG: inorganic diphosphatase [Candidatus Cyclobacteriaceae bacterium M3_2C_046]
MEDQQKEQTMMYSHNPWHSVEYGDRAPEIVNSVIEIPTGTRAKYELHKPSGLLILDRVLYSSVYYPHNYGFIPQTLAEDDDPLDILVLSKINVVPLCIVSAKVIGVMRMIDSGKPDDKIIAVAENDMSVNHYSDIGQLNKYYEMEMRGFFEDYKKLEHKEVRVEQFQDREVAIQIVIDSINRYKEKYQPDKMNDF